MTYPLHVLTAVVDVTPDAAVPMGGHGGPPRLTSSPPHGRLEINVLAFERHGEPVAILVAVDALFVGAALRDAVTSACAARFGCDESHVMVLASHTHSAPMLDGSKPLLGQADPIEVARWKSGIASAFARLTSQVVDSAQAGRGETALSVNRRLKWPVPTVARILGKTTGDVYICDNPHGPRDPRIRTVLWKSGSRPVALVWTFACHPTGFPANDRASPDYIGVVRDALRARFRTSLPVIFAPGCMGDVRPASPRLWWRWCRWPAVFLHGPQPVPFRLDEWEEWARCLAHEVAATCEAATHRDVRDPIAIAPTVALPLSDLFAGRGPVSDFRAKAFNLPGLGRILSLTCEPVTEIADRIEAAASDWIVGYEGDVFGYLPTEALIAEGGYEAERFKAHFGLAGAFRPGLDQIIRELGRRLRADLPEASCGKIEDAPADGVRQRARDR